MTDGPPLAAADPVAGSDTGRTALGSLTGLSVVVFLIIVGVSVHRTPGPLGTVQGLISAVAVAGLFWFLGGRGVRWLSSLGTKTAPPTTGEIDPSLAPTLRELETVRVDIAARIGRRMHRWLPLGMAGESPSGPSVNCASARAG